MPELSVSLAAASILAGFLMFLAPCTLPLVPGYLAFISGVSQKDIDTKNGHRKIIINAISFSLGFSFIFIFFGLLAGFFGEFVGVWRDLLSVIGGALVIIFGLMMLDFFKIPKLSKTYSFKIPTYVTPGHPSSAALIGAIFALGWTPCVGPILATVLLLASTNATVESGALLLALFSLGLAVPFILTAILYSKVQLLIGRYASTTKFIQKTGGMFLLLIGLLLLINQFELTVEYGYVLFTWLGLEGFFEHL